MNDYISEIKSLEKDITTSQIAEDVGVVAIDTAKSSPDITSSSQNEMTDDLSGVFLVRDYFCSKKVIVKRYRLKK